LEHCSAGEYSLALPADKLLAFSLHCQEERVLETPGENHDLTVFYLLSQGYLHRRSFPVAFL